MAGALLFAALSKYLQHYLQDFERSDLKVGLLRGEAQMANLQLRVEALEPLLRGLPLRIVQAKLSRCC